ncbi:TPA: MgtC/SapB family protein [Listeria monocytogenes]|uniref:MgtC/SapB family protein n=1 Tax=Listeria monocytogenes TaxID=1639 RepID=UPI00124A74A3|nr:MgtC/SapB family protein [Listeria monocytogenes]QEZ04558.1 methyltransferase [Listeria monocytogenes]HAA3201248.1 methyltransferase [Listeria monocytogenes]HAA4584126.1 methyltransferase [Listeria monocytogenes]HDI3924121.1 MgtC/SapB family protein [Listeria monocytogenes]HDI4278041.1 MgtC/SapB family protein [Listeria monocytogenes]
MLADFILRLVVAGLLGAIIGLDRETRAKEAGFRTHFLVSLGSALIMIVSQYGFSEIATMQNVSFDPSRVAAQVVSGIGFIGAGTIIIQKKFVRGLTTAAGLWATAGIGLAIGAGMYWVGIAATLLTLIGLEFLSIVFKSFAFHTTAIIYSTDKQENLVKVTDKIQQNKQQIVSYSSEKELIGESLFIRVNIVVKTKNKNDEYELFHFIQTLPNVTVEKME